MSVDKLVDSTQLDSDLTSVANAIRAKSGESGQLAFPAGFVSAIDAIPSGGGSVSGYGDPYTMVYGVANYFSVSGGSYLFLDEGMSTKRRSVWASSGEHSATLYVSPNNYGPPANVYPIPIPSGSTKVSVSPDVTNQMLLSFYSYSNNWDSIGASGWVNSPVSEYGIPSGATHVAISLRVSANNEVYSYDTQPKTVEITFS